MISIIIILFLAWSIYVGYSRGLTLQLFYTAGMITGLVSASQGYQNLAAKISMWVPFANASDTSKLRFFNNNVIFQLDKTFYSGVAFLIIFTGVYLTFRFIGIFLGFLSSKELLGRSGKIISAILAFIGMYLGIEMVLTILAMVPINGIQDKLYASGMAKFMVLKTPIIHNFLIDMWFEKVIHLNPIK